MSPKNDIEPASGILLIAAANLLDPNFARSVVLICEHMKEGTFGLVLNRELPVKVSDLISDDLGWDAEVLKGGPVQENTLHFLHCRDDLDLDSQKILPGVYWGGEFERACELIRSGLAKPDDFRFFVGYAGWGEGQLAGEIEQNSWYLQQGSKSLVFAGDLKNHWRNTLRSMGQDYRLLSMLPDDPRLN